MKLYTVNFLEKISIISYGKLRKILLDYGKRFEDRMEIIYMSVLVVSSL